MLFGKKETTELKISGMKCAHCSANVKKALEAIKGVKAEVSHEEGKAVITAPAGTSRDELVKAVEDAGFEVVG